MTGRPLGVGVIGLGFMGKTHVEAWQAANAAGRACRLVAAADRNPERRTGHDASVGNLGRRDEGRRLFDPDEVRGHETATALLADDRVDVVSICTPTDTHVALAVDALAAGKHVLVEKPVALTAAAIEPLARAAGAARRLCMPAHCMRFWPGWTWLAERVRDRRFGAVESAVFQRLGARPAWSPEFYRDASRSGGALVDLHIHDADFVRFLFGDPERVTSGGDADHLTTVYHYANGPRHVMAEGGWDHAPGFGFRMRYVVVFEEATADFDLTRDPPLRLFHGGEEEKDVELPGASGYEAQVIALLDAIEAGASAPVTVDDALGTARLLDAERVSLATGAPAPLA